MAATGVARGTDVDTGGNVMLGGIALQMGTFLFIPAGLEFPLTVRPTAAISIYSLCAAEFLTRYFTDRPIREQGNVRGVLTARLKLLIGALALSTVCLFIR